jgi:hypothetical protein
VICGGGAHFTRSLRKSHRKHTFFFVEHKFNYPVGGLLLPFCYICYLLLNLKPWSCSCLVLRGVVYFIVDFLSSENE